MPVTLYNTNLFWHHYQVSLARIYDAPLTADEVKALYEDVRE